MIARATGESALRQPGSPGEGAEPAHGEAGRPHAHHAPQSGALTPVPLAERQGALHR